MNGLRATGLPKFFLTQYLVIVCQESDHEADNKKFSSGKSPTYLGK